MNHLKSIGRTTSSHRSDSPGIHQPSHVHLLSPVGRYEAAAERLDLSAVVVPTSRPAGMSSGLILASQIAAAKGAHLVVLRSGAAAGQAFPRDLIPASPRETLVIDLPPGAAELVHLTSDRLTVATYRRESDLGRKRDLAIVLGRICGWKTILFLDDDIRTTPSSGPATTDPRFALTQSLNRLDDVLAEFAFYPHLHAAGHFQRDMDDNSVVCHARRLVGKPQEIFISGGALAVRVDGPLPFFPSVYNEDWLFFLKLMLDGHHTMPSSALRYVGTIHQDTYYPFKAPRARSEELGDLLAEGLFSLIGESRLTLLSRAMRTDFWEEAASLRFRMIGDVLADVLHGGAGPQPDVMADAEQALLAAREVYRDPGIDVPVVMAEFCRAWAADQHTWRDFLDAQTTPNPLDLAGAVNAVDMAGLSRLYVSDTHRKAS